MDIEDAFEKAMRDIYDRAKDEFKYNATGFLRMIRDRGALSTAKYLINTDQPSSGYTELYMRGGLHLTVEALVVENEKWHALFTKDEIDKAKKRLSQLGYQPRT